jgi:hypothetical protein
MKPTKSPRPLALERIRQRLERWRRTRAHPRAPIPERIWADAVALARQQGLYQTARALPIHYGGLKQHLEAADRTVGASARSGFVELRPRNPTGDDDCVIEVEGLRTTVRLRLRRVELPDLAQLSRAIAGIDA